MAVANNADDYAVARQNIFFSGVVPELDGQCVSLVKWFLQEMTSVPDPQAARGDARYVGHTLVNQGHAVEVPYADRRQGDVICLEYGVYGHIYVQLSGNRVFEENVSWPGVASKIVNGARVYASRIGSDSEAWRHDFHCYRIKSYNGGTMSSQTPADETTIKLEYNNGLFRDALPNEVQGLLGQTVEAVQRTIGGAPEHSDLLGKNALGVQARKLLGNDVSPQNMESKMIAKYGNTSGNCTPDERAFLDTMYKIVTKKG